ncbi:Creatinine amidohydrolase [Hartmannibacter diazotrophicus]|uniref:Creatinine amidohydrolase n=1 Tax=Hartmannibacter diazotrophicus TaxID=1482074 RepID=A0A2C9DDQ9_9HYPH|nr:creatininase family protein [Hartmannibacter diazotrophicus]SON58238.1 Creatinine amidohydrolase [Hartmannibacter diazotrophicus]
MALPFFWNEMNTTDFAGLDPERTVAVLPIASTEQHGPHLPIATDAAIATGMIAEVKAQKPDDLDLLVLPIQEIGKANEHVYGPGTLSFGADLLIPAWTAIGEKVNAAGVKKLIIVNSHGGNVDIMSIVARELRVRFAMAVVATQWSRFGTPEGLYDEREKRYGIHGGDMETSLMLHFRPDLVRMERAMDFVSAAEDMSATYTFLQPTPPHALAWIAHDLNPHGALGDASKATAAKGAETCHYQAAAFLALARDLKRFPLGNLYKP